VVLQAELKSLAEAAHRDLAALPDRAGGRVHDIRVGMKRFRAILRLAGAVIRPAKLASCDRLAKKIKASLGLQRDHDVQVELLRELIGKRMADAALDAEPFEPVEITAPASSELGAKLVRLTAGLDLSDLNGQQLLSAWAATYRTARRTMNACQDDRADDFLFHEWRKCVKQFLYQAAILGPAAAVRVPAAQELSTALGRQHDLAILCQNVHRYGPDAELVAFSRKRRAVREALRIGRTVFRDKPADLVKNYRNHG